MVFFGFVVGKQLQPAKAGVKTDFVVSSMLMGGLLSVWAWVSIWGKLSILADQSLRCAGATHCQ